MIVKGINIPIGTMLDCELVGEAIVFSYQGQEVFVADAGEEKDKFKLRKKLKAVVLPIQGSEEEVEIKILRFADLHRHSENSILDGMSKVEELAKKTEYAGALTDHGVMFGYVDYYKAMKEAGKKPIMGFEAYMETIDGKKEGCHLVLLAKNEQGLRNLIKLCSKAYDNFYNKPHVSYEMLRKYSEGLIGLSGCVGGEIPQLILSGQYEKAKEVALELEKIFGKGDFYLEIQRHHIPEEAIVNAGLIRLSQETGIKLVATTDSHYTEKEDSEVHEMMLALQTQTTLSDPKRFRFSGTGYHIHTPEEMEKLFQDLPQALDATLEIAEKCNVEIELDKRFMPEFTVPEGFSSQDEYFEHLCWEGFKKRFGGKKEEKDPKYLEALKFEIKMIQKMGFSGYFLIVWDVINWAKNQGILVGPGRGSVVGSLVAYCLNITELDPLPLGLFFERFLNPERVSMPDIDIDFQKDRRDEVLDYVKNKYGFESVSGIVTFGTLGAKMSVRDVARVLGYPVYLGDTIAKAIPNTPGITLSEALELPELKALYDNNPDVKKIIDYALKIEGLKRNVSQHACGKVIAPGAVSDFLPEFLAINQETKEKSRTTQITNVEELGLLKMDFLGLRTLTVVADTIKMANKKLIKEGKPIIKYPHIPFEKEVFEYIATGELDGVFQLESQGMRKFMKELFHDASTVSEDQLPQLFERLVAGLSLYRPGPLEYIDDYLARMRDPSLIEYDTPDLEEILKPTYGIIVYQEQVMQIVQKLAGYSLARADIVRRAMGKKKADVMASEEKGFIDGCLKNGYSQEVAETVWGKMEDFAKYAFNKSHAAGYALLSYITAYLKYHFPTEYMTALLNSFINNISKLKAYMWAAKKMKIAILPPDINKSEKEFTIEGNMTIRFGLQGIKNLGKIADAIIAERRKGGQYKDLQDFVERMTIFHKIDKRVVESLIYAGALDSFEGTRQAKLQVLPQILASAALEKEQAITGQLDIFSLSAELANYKRIKTPAIPEFNKKEKMAMEKEYAGFYITEHPLDEYEKYFVAEGVLEIASLISEAETADLNEKAVKVAAIIKGLTPRYTKAGEVMYTFTAEDRTGDLPCVIFPKDVALNRNNLVNEKIVFLSGVLKHDDRGLQLIVNTILDIEEAKWDNPRYILVRAIDDKQIIWVKKLMAQPDCHGNVPLYIQTPKGKVLKAKQGFNVKTQTITKLKDLFGVNLKVS